MVYRNTNSFEHERCVSVVRCFGLKHVGQRLLLYFRQFARPVTRTNSNQPHVRTYQKHFRLDLHKSCLGAKRRFPRAPFDFSDPTRFRSAFSKRRFETPALRCYARDCVISWRAKSRRHPASGVSGLSLSFTDVGWQSIIDQVGVSRDA